jgi:hypothetical protein
MLCVVKSLVEYKFIKTSLFLFDKEIITMYPKRNKVARLLSTMYEERKLIPSGILQQN